MAIKVTNNFKKVINNITENKARQVLVAIEAGAANRAIFHAPVEYSNLVNSYFGNVEKTGHIWRLRVGFGVDYAVYLNNMTNWKPRPPTLKQGPGYNPNATPHFLDYHGFESPEAKADIDKTIKVIMKL